MLGRVSDLERHRRRTERQLAVGGCLIVVLVGGGLVALLYGTTAALVAVVVVALAVGVGGLVWLLVSLLQRWAQQPEDGAGTTPHTPGPGSRGREGCDRAVSTPDE
jgi:hypothetical protein